MIKELQLKNFQSHRDSKLSFHPGVNVIVGASDSGKSAILRALRLVVFNRPGGEAYRSNWGGHTSVFLTTENATIKRQKDTHENSYIMEKTMPAVFTAFGTNVPEPIKAELNMDEVNIQRQLDSPFLLSDSDTPGQVAAYFNKIAGIDVIDKAIKQAKQEIAQTEKVIRYKKDDLAAKKVKLMRYDNLHQFDDELTVLEDKEKKRNTLSKQSRELGTLIGWTVKASDEYEQEKEFLEVEKPLLAIFDKMQQRDSVKKKIKQLTDKIEHYNWVAEELHEKQKLQPLLPMVQKLQQKIAQKGQFQAELGRLNALVIKCTTVNKKCEETAQIALIKKQLFDKHLTTCPLCGTKIK